MRELTEVTRALADESRLRLLAALEGGELCVCQLTELLELAPSTVSKHLSQLRAAGLLEARKDGRWVHYRLAGRGSTRTVRRALAWVREALADDPGTREDARRLRKILAVDPAVLCGGQRTSASSGAARPGEARRV